MKYTLTTCFFDRTIIKDEKFTLKLALKIFTNIQSFHTGMVI